MSLNKTILILFSLSLVLTLNPTLEKNYFFVNTNNRLSQELFQTRYGIVAHNAEFSQQYLSIDGKYISKYILIDLASKDAFPILTKTTSACESTAPTFQHLHYHVQTESLVYFCATNSSLLFIDQSNFTVQSAIPLNTNSTWPVASLSTDGMNVVILTMDNLFNQSSTQASTLFTVNMQTKTLSTQILFNQNLSAGENVVAYATGKKATYIATNKVQDHSLTTAVYSLIMVGNTYQLTPVANFASIVPYSVVTKLFCLGNFVIVNNGQNLNFINQQGAITKTVQLRIKSITGDSNTGLYSPSVTSQAGSSFLYLQDIFASVHKYSIIDSAILVKDFGTFGEFQIAYGNSTSGDLMFALDYGRVWFAVTDLQTAKTVYSVIAGYSDVMLTETTYAIVQGVSYTDYYVYIFDSKTDALINKIPIGLNEYFYNKDQQIITFVNTSISSGCAIAHIEIASGKVWNTLSFSSPNQICLSWVVNARITENGNPEVVLPFTDYYLIISETYGHLTFNATGAATTNLDSLNINFDDLSVYYLVSNQLKLNINASYYTFDPQSKQFQLNNSKIVATEAKDHGLFTVNSTMSIAISKMTLSLINELSEVFFHIVPQSYNFASAFSDSDGKQYVIVASKGLYGIAATGPGLIWTEGLAMPLPGVRGESNSAQATGLNSYAIYDDISQAFGLVRFYNAASSKAKQTLISI